jgi:hypothetical protein
MGALIERVTAGGRGLWLDYGAYAARLLAGGQAPWLDADAAGAWLRKAQGLLKSDVVTLPAAAVVAAWLEANPALVTAMGAKKRTVYALRSLLADEGLRAHLELLTRVLRASLPGAPLVLALPSPRLWVGQAYARANGGEAAAVDADAVDSAAAYVADFLRGFAEAGLDGLLLEESTETEPASAADVQLYQAVLNVAAHYRWDVGLRLPQGRGALAAQGLAYVLSPVVAAGVATGLCLPAEFWSGAAAPAAPAGGFRHAEIPAAANPEAVLERLAALR